MSSSAPHAYGSDARAAYILEHPDDFEGFSLRFSDATRDAWRSKRTRLRAAGLLEGISLREMTLPASVEVLGAQTVVDDATDEDYEELFRLLERVDELKETLSPTQDSTEFHAPNDGLPVGVCFTGDWHLGASGVDSVRLLNDLERIGSTPGVYAVGMGDYIEGVGIQNKAASALYSGLLNSGNLQEIYAVLRMRKAQGKWLALISGNHDEWLARSSGLSRVDRLAQQLGTHGQRPPHFCQGGGTIFAHVGEQRYVIAVTHNAKGNSRLNTSNAGRRSFDEWPVWDNCDVICCGHLHYNDLHTQTRKGQRCVYLRSGTAKIRDGYAADNGFKPEYGIPLAVLYPDRRWVLPFRGDDLDAGLRFLAAERERYAGVPIAA